MRELKALVKRDSKLFFKDKGLFFTSLITPMILLFLYVAFLGNVYRDGFESILTTMGPGVPLSDKLLNACTAGQLISSLFAVCCVTVAFCSNMLMVNDKVNGAGHDLTITPVKRSTMALGYYISTLISTLIVCFAAMVVCLIYVASVGWYMSLTDVLLIILDVFLLVMFGTALSSVVNFFLSSQGQISAVGTIVSAGYGFICGAYMPISQFSDGLQKVISFLPGTYGTSLLRTHAMNGAFAEIQNSGFPVEAVEEMKNAFDSNVYFFGEKVSISAMYLILAGAAVLLIAVYVVMNVIKGRKHS